MKKLHPRNEVSCFLSTILSSFDCYLVDTEEKIFVLLWREYVMTIYCISFPLTHMVIGNQPFPSSVYETRKMRARRTSLTIGAYARISIPNVSRFTKTKALASQGGMTFAATNWNRWLDQHFDDLKIILSITGVIYTYSSLKFIIYELKKRGKELGKFEF